VFLKQENQMLRFRTVSFDQGVIVVRPQHLYVRGECFQICWQKIPA
jgi:hypothetical protein